MSQFKNLISIGIFVIILTFVNAFVFNTLLDFLFADTIWLLVLVISIAISIGCVYIHYLAHSRSSDRLDRTYNGVSMWFGILFNLFFGSLLYWLILLFTGSAWLAFTPIVFAVLLFLFGIKRAKDIIVKEITVEFDNLPDDWKNKQLAFISDLHLGKTLSQDFLSRVITIINEHEVKALLIGGDLFDSVHAPWSEILAPFKDLNILDNVFYVTGNHEYYVNYELDLRHHIEELGFNLLESSTYNLDGVIIGGISHSLSDINFNFESEFNKLDFKLETPNILIYHEPIPTHSKYALNNHTNLQLSGHTHFGQVAPFNLLTWLRFGNFDYGLFHNKPNNTYQYTSSGIGSWGPPVRTTARPEVVILTLK